MWPSRAAPRPRSGAEDGRTPCPKGGGQEELTQSEVRGSGRELQAATAQERQGGATPCLRPGAVPRRSHPMSKEQWLCGCGMAQRSYPTLKIRKGSGEEITLVQGKEQWLGFAGAAVKRYSMSKVRETPARW